MRGSAELLLPRRTGKSGGGVQMSVWLILLERLSVLVPLLIAMVLVFDLAFCRNCRVRHVLLTMLLIAAITLRMSWRAAMGTLW
jgi:ABC-type proline/glycine betaine transport system permease subunit